MDSKGKIIGLSVLLVMISGLVSAGSFTIDSDKEWRNNGTLTDTSAVNSKLFVGEGDNFEDSNFDWEKIDADGAWNETNGYLLHDSSGTGGAKAQEPDFNITSDKFGYKFNGWVNGGGNHIFFTNWDAETDSNPGSDGIFLGMYPGGNELRIDDRTDGNSNKATTSVTLSDKVYYDMRGYLNITNSDSLLQINTDNDSVYEASVRNNSILYNPSVPLQTTTWLAPDSRWKYLQVYSLYNEGKYESNAINDGNTSVKDWTGATISDSKISSSDSFTVNYQVSNSTSGFQLCSTPSDITSCDNSEYIKFNFTLTPGGAASTPKIDSIQIDYQATGTSSKGDGSLSLTLDDPRNKTYTQNYVWVNGSTNEKANITYSLDGGSKQSLGDQVTSFSKKITNLSNGNHTIDVDAVDSNDSTDTASKYREFKVDNTPASGIDRGLKLHYRMNDTSSDTVIEDWSGLNNDGDATSGLNYGVNGIVQNGTEWGTGEAIDFQKSKNEHINVTKIDFRNDNFTVSTWVNPKGDLDQQSRIIAGSDSAGEFTYYLQTTGGSCTGTCYLGGFRSSSDNYHVAKKNVSSLDSGWQMLTLTYNGSMLKLYQNTTKIASTSVSAGLENTTKLYVSQSPYFTSGDAWNNTIDEPKIYNRSLNSSEIKDVFWYNRETSSTTSSAPSININKIEDGKYFNTVEKQVQFNWTSSTNSSRNLVNTSIYHNKSGSWSKVKTFQLSGTKQTVTFKDNFTSSGSYKWMVKTYDNVSSVKSSNRSFTVQLYKKWAMFTDNHYGNVESDGAYNDNQDFLSWITGYKPDLCTNYGDVTAEGIKGQFEDAYGNFSKIISQTPCSEVWFTPGASHDAYSDKTEGDNAPGGDVGWFGMRKMISGYNQTSMTYTIEEGNIAHIYIPTVSQNSTTADNIALNPGSGQYGFVPYHSRQYLKEQLNYYCSKDYNIIVGTHRQLYRTNIYSGGDWYGADQPTWKNTTAELLQVMNNAPCSPDLFLNGHVHRQSNDFHDNTNMQGGTFVWGSGGRAELPDGTVFGMIPVIADEHGKEATSQTHFSSVLYANLTEGKKYIELHARDVENGTSVGFTYNDTSTAKSTLKIPLSHPISFGNNSNGNKFDTWNQSFQLWDSPALDVENGENQLFRPTEGMYFDENSTWAEFRWEFNKERSFKDLNLSWSESNSGCCSVNYEVSSSNSLKSGWSSWYDDPENAPAGKFWRVNLTIITNSYVVIQDMEFTNNEVTNSPVVSDTDLSVKNAGGSASTEINVSIDDNGDKDIKNYTNISSGSVQSFSNSSLIISNPNNPFDYSLKIGDNTGLYSNIKEINYTKYTPTSCYVQDSSRSSNESSQAVKCSRKINVRGEALDVSVSFAEPSALVNTVQNGGSVQDATGNHTFVYEGSVDHIETKIFGVFQSDSKSSDSDRQYVEKIKEYHNNWSTDYSNLSTKSVSLSGTKTESINSSIDIQGSSKVNLTARAYSDWIVNEKNGSMDNASSKVVYGSGIKANWTGFQNISVENSRSDIGLDVDLSPAIPDTVRCSVVNNTVKKVSASTVEEFDFKKSCNPGDENDYSLVKTVKENSSEYDYNGSVEVYTDRTSEVKHQYWIKKSRLTDFDSRNKSSVNASIDGIEKGLGLSVKSRDGSEYLVMTAFTNRTQSSVHQGSHSFVYAYSVPESSDSGGSSGGGTSSTQTQVTESPYNWSVTLIDSEFVGVYKPTVRPGQSFQREILVESDSSDINIDVKCKSEANACKWVETNLDKIKFDSEGQTTITVTGRVPKDAKKDTYRFTIVFTDPAHREGTDIGKNTVNFVVSTETRLDLLFEFWNDLLGFYNGIPIAVIGMFMAVLFLIPAWALGKLEKYPKIVPTVAFLIFLITVGVF